MAGYLKFKFFSLLLLDLFFIFYCLFILQNFLMHSFVQSFLELSEISSFILLIIQTLFKVVKKKLTLIEGLILFIPLCYDIYIRSPSFMKTVEVFVLFDLHQNIKILFICLLQIFTLLFLKELVQFCSFFLIFVHISPIRKSFVFGNCRNQPEIIRRIW